MNRKIICCLAIILISGCSLAPEFKMPEMNMPQSFKEPATPVTNENQGSWKVAAPQESADRGEWWKIFGDEQLNRLETEAVNANQSLKAAAERLEQARGAMRIARADFFPSADLGGNAVRSKPSGAAAQSFGAPAGTNLKPYTLYSAGAGVSYEADLFGRVRDSYNAAKSEAAAEEGIYRSVLLALTADVAQNYFAIRTLDSERNLLRNTVKIREEARRIMNRRFEEGDASEQDHVRAKAELASALADLISLERQRNNAGHALAILLGKLPAEFSLAEMPLTEMPPAIPSGIPSSLLERRPDIVAAQESMAAANSRIGVARSAFFPQLTLTATGGVESASLSDLFKWSSRTWALGNIAGSALTIPLFRGGAGFANLDIAKSGYQESVANYRQQVLVAFREVEDNLSDQKLLSDQLIQSAAASDAATRSADLSRKRYQEGETSYFEVVDEERNALLAQRATVGVRGTRFVATVNLIRALGGGWQGQLQQQPEATPATVPPQKTPAEAINK